MANITSVDTKKCRLKTDLRRFGLSSVFGVFGYVFEDSDYYTLKSRREIIDWNEHGT